MSVTNYTPDKCRYLVEKLAKTVYLISEDAVKDIRIDNGDAYINSVSESPMRLDCYSINLQEEESLDERYRFTHTLTFSVNGYANSDDFQGRFYAIVKDNEGTYWLVNPLFPCKVTYTYTLGYEQNHTDFTLGTVSNHPVLRIHNFGDATPYECQEYFLDGIDALWLNEKRYTVHDGNSVKYTNDGFKTIEYNQRTATFTETFDGTNTSHQIDFDILFSQYKSSWHYNLLEFKDNLYSAIFKTRNNKYALCGFSFGLQPSFKINADDTIQSADRIQITLQDAHDVGDAIEFFDSIDYEYLSARTYEYTSEYDGYECIGEGVARYLLQKEVDVLGNETGNYKVLEGYAGRFPGLNIVGTFSSIETFINVECNGSGCTIDTSFPSMLTFNNKECQTYYLKADSSWSISSSENYITVSPSSGEAGIGYQIHLCNTLTPGAVIQRSTLNIQYCSTSTTVDVNVVQNSGCFPQGAVYNISANAQVLNVPTACCVQSVRETTNVGSSTIIYNSYLAVTVPENNTGRYRTITLLIVFCDGTSANVTINQSNVFEKWEDYGDPFCMMHDLYKKQYLWTGYTSSSYVITDESRDLLVEKDSPECDYLERWVNSGTTCSGESLYNLQIKQISYDGGITWTNAIPEEYRTGDLIEECSDECAIPMPSVDMTGKLLVSLNSDGSTVRDYDCCVIPPDADPSKYNLVALEPAGTDECAVYTSRNGGLGLFVYVGECANTTPYAFRDYVFGSCDVGGCGRSIYFEGGQNFNLSRGLFNGSRIRKVVVGDPAMTFHMENIDTSGATVPGATFSGGCGDISEVLLRTTNVATDAFAEGEFGNTATFGQTVLLSKDAFHWASFTSIIFNNGFSLSDSALSDFSEVFETRYGYKPTITLNGSADNYPDYGGMDIAQKFIYEGFTVVDNRVFSTGFTAYYSNGQQFDDVCRENSILTSGVTKPNGYDYTLMTSASVGSCYKWIGYESASGYTFSGCISLTGVTFGGDIEGFGLGAFSGCTSLTSIGTKGSGASVEIPDSVTELPMNVFRGCTGLTYIEIPSGITSIGAYAFYSASRGNLHTLKLNSTTPPMLSSASFLPNLASDFQILVPCGSLNTYKTYTYWSYYSMYMVEYDC